MLSGDGMTRLVDALEDSGFLHREANPNDRRSYIVKLTTKGRQAHDKLLPIVQDVMDAALQGFSSEQRRIARSVLKQIRANLRDE